jgi:hypothetical protein
MINPSRKGIYCDLCGAEVLIKNSSIEYFSSNFRHIVSKSNSNSTDEVLDVDLCSECYQKIYDRVYKVSLENDKKRKKASKYG